MPPRIPATREQLALIQALIQGGQLARAMELLEALWPDNAPDEQCWYFRLWLLAGQGRIHDAVELARVATRLLPGSAAISYLHAALEVRAGDPHAAVEAALRAAAIAPGRAEPEILLDVVLNGVALRTERATSDRPGLSEPPMNPVAAALAGLALLHPRGSASAFRPGLPARKVPVPVDRAARDENRRIGLMAAAVVIAAVWSVRDPLLASAALAAVVAWLSRPRRSKRT